MRMTIISLALLVALACGLHACSSAPSKSGAAAGPGGPASAQAAPDPRVAEEQREKLAYGVGYYLGGDVRDGLNADGIELDLDLLMRGFRDGLRDRTPMMARSELDAILYQVHAEMERRMVARLLQEDPHFQTLYEQNLAASEAYLQANAQAPGVSTLPGGVQYRVLSEGRGPSPGPDDTVVVNYRGMLIDGTVFGEEEGAALQVSKLMAGGREVLPRMRVGDRWQVAVPSDAAFGAAGNPPLIGPNQVLLFDITLVEVKPQGRKG
jgi:FKBP-type peptidyl-prolyl cis-trans isomerase FklB